MNFKGTDQHPARRDEGHRRAVRRHVERLHLDRPDDLSRDGRQRTRSTRCSSSKPSGWRSGLYDPDECESERTVIISELQGGENDPEQLLDTEVTATALRVHPYGHPTIGWLQDLQSMTPRRPLQPLPPPLRPQQRHAGRRRRRRCRRRAAARRAAFRSDSRGLEICAAQATAEPPQIGERRVLLEREGTTAYLKLAYPAPAADEADFFPMLVLDAVADGRQGSEPLVRVPRSPPQRSARLYTALVERGLASVGVRRAAADRRSVPLSPCR